LKVILQGLARSPEIHRRGLALGPREWDIPNKLRRRTENDESGAEMIEFAIVVVLLIALLYGIITYGLILAAQATVTQAAADAARSGIVSSTTAVATAEAQAGTDVGWMNKGTCGTSGTTITCLATTIPCPSNINNTCLKVVVTYNYSTAPLFPVLPGLGVVTPSTISSTNILQLSTPSS
jgi:Flp pilus assembly protein TadG